MARVWGARAPGLRALADAETGRVLVRGTPSPTTGAAADRRCQRIAATGSPTSERASARRQSRRPDPQQEVLCRDRGRRARAGLGADVTRAGNVSMASHSATSARNNSGRPASALAVSRLLYNASPVERTSGHAKRDVNDKAEGRARFRRPARPPSSRCYIRTRDYRMPSTIALRNSIAATGKAHCVNWHHRCMPPIKSGPFNGRRRSSVPMRREGLPCSGDRAPPHPSRASAAFREAFDRVPDNAVDKSA
jgi:hypothetical protein